MSILFCLRSLVGAGLNLASHQSEFAQALLKKIDLVLKSDKKFVERIKKHYNLFRAEIDKKYNKVQ